MPLLDTILLTLPGATALKDLKKIELRLLQAIEAGMRYGEYVELDTIAKYAKISTSDASRWLKNCHKQDLIHRWSGHFVGYELTIHGYDSLALNTLYEQNKIRSIGREKGVGKESKIHYALNGEEEEVAIKLHRVGFTSFHQVKKKRRYTANKRHISALYSSRLSAEAEFKWLKHADGLNLPVPEVYAWNRHIISMELVDGIDLVKVNNLPDPGKILHHLLDFIEISWNKGSFVHGDLSEHNVIMTHDAEPIVIDFPQAIEKTAEGADELLERDVKNILTYFNRKYGIAMDHTEVLNVIKN